MDKISRAKLAELVADSPKVTNVYMSDRAVFSSLRYTDTGEACLWTITWKDLLRELDKRYAAEGAPTAKTGSESVSGDVRKYREWDVKREVWIETRDLLCPNCNRWLYIKEKVEPRSTQTVRRALEESVFYVEGD